MTMKGMRPSMAVEGSTTKKIFEAYVKHFLASVLREGQMVVIDNLVDRREGLQVALLAALLAGPKPHRRGLLEDQGLLAESRGAYARGVGGGFECISQGGHGPGHPRLLRALRLPHTGATSPSIAATAYRSNNY
jgi:hypothetical protein